MTDKITNELYSGNDEEALLERFQKRMKEKPKAKKKTPTKKVGYADGAGEKKKQTYPIVSFGGVREHAFPAVKEYMLHAIVKGIYNASGVEAHAEDNLLMSTVDSFMNATILRYHAGYTNRVPKMFPLPYVWERFAESPSDIDKVYTAEMANFEFPIYLMDDAGKKPEPSDELLRENIDKTAETGATPYNDANMLISHYKDFSTLAANKYTRGDFARLEDVQEFRKWFVRDDTWLIQQLGEVVETKTVTTEKGKDVKVNVYKKPGRFETWKYWVVGDIIYDLVDAPLDKTVQPLIQTYVPDREQEFLKKEYTAISAMRRNMFSGARLKLLYDVTDLSTTSEAQTVGDALKAYR